MANELVPQRGVTTREEFGGLETKAVAETAALAITARERAMVEAMYLMAERHPRNLDTVRVRLVGHCKRSTFAEAAMYKKPTGKKQINGEWQETYAEGLSARFAEAARLELGNLKSGTAVVYEDDAIRIVDAYIIDMERNNIDGRSAVISKTVEKRGKKDRQGNWQPPEGREPISQRVNSYGEPVYLVKATEDEIRNRQNSEISKIQRDATLRALLADIKEEAIRAVKETLADPKQTDPTAARKRLVDAFAAIGVMPDDLVTFMGSPLDRLSPLQVDELRGLYTAIRDGEATFQEALKARFGSPDDDGEEETREQHDARLQRQMRQQEKRDNVAEEKIAKLRGQKADSPATQGQPSRAADEPKPAPVAEPAEAAGKHEPPPPTPTTPTTQPGSGERGTAVHGQGPGETSAAAGGTTVKSPSAPTPGPTSDFWKQCNRIEADLGTQEFKRVLGTIGYTAVDEVPPRDQERVLAELRQAQAQDRALFNQAPDEAGPGEGAYREEPPKRGRSGFGGRRS